MITDESSPSIDVKQHLQVVKYDKSSDISSEFKFLENVNKRLMTPNSKTDGPLMLKSIFY